MALSEFNYSSLNQEIRDAIRYHATEIRSLRGRKPSEIIEIGKRLSDVKSRLGFGEWGRWLETEFSASADTAERFQRAAMRLGKSPLSDKQLDMIAPSALYLLCKPSAPPSAILKTTEIVSQGQPVTYSMAREIISQEDASIQSRGHINSLRPKRSAIITSETQLERCLIQRLRESGAIVRSQVWCVAGIADVVTETHIYEVKFRADRSGLFKAIGQVLVYRQAIDHALVPVVVIVDSQRDELLPIVEIASMFGVEVQLWPIYSNS